MHLLSVSGITGLNGLAFEMLATLPNEAMLANEDEDLRLLLMLKLLLLLLCCQEATQKIQEEKAQQHLKKIKLMGILQLARPVGPTGRMGHVSVRLMLDQSGQKRGK